MKKIKITSKTSKKAGILAFSKDLPILLLNVPQSQVSVAFRRLKMLSPNSACQSFSKNGDGYARAEGVAVVVITKKDVEWLRQVLVPEASADGIRAYAKLQGWGCNSDGFTEKGITFPNGDAQYELYKKVAEKARVKPEELVYIEAHGTGTQAGDAQETEALRKAYKISERDESLPPLLIGSVKSNMGHAEGASGLAGLTKLLLSYEHRMIPGDLHYTYEDRNPTCENLLGNPQLCKVVDVNTEWCSDGDLKAGRSVSAISSFGFGGTNSHCVLKAVTLEEDGIVMRRDKEMTPKINHDNRETYDEINAVYGRTEEGVSAILENLANENVKFSKLIGCQGVKEAKSEQPVLGYRVGEDAFFGNTTDACDKVEVIESGDQIERPVWLVFSGNGGMWPTMGKQLYEQSPIYRKVYDRCDDYLKKRHNCDSLEKVLAGIAPAESYTAIDGVCGLAAVQICLIELLKHMFGSREELERRVGGYIGHSAGETAMGYVDNLLTIEQTLSVAYYRSLCGASTVDPKNPGAMYAVGLPYERARELVKDCEHSTVGCDNDPGLVTLSGSKAELGPILQAEERKWTEAGKKFFCRQIPTFGVAYHSKMLEPGLGALRRQLRSAIDDKRQRRRSSKWISTCFDDDELAEDHPGRFLNSDYHCFNFLNRVRFHSACKKIPDNAVILEVGPHALFRSSIKKIAAAEGKEWTYIPLMLRGEDSFHAFQKAYGSMLLKNVFAGGERGTLNNLMSVPEVRSQRSIRQSFIQWDHSTVYPLPELRDMMNKLPGVDELSQVGGADSGFRVAVDFDFNGEDKFMLDHVIDDTVLMPACGYLYSAWKAYLVYQMRQQKLADSTDDVDEASQKNRSFKEQVAQTMKDQDTKISDFKIHQGIRLDESNRELRLVVTLTPSDKDMQRFKIMNGDELIATGKLSKLKSNEVTKVISAPITGKKDILDRCTFYNRIARNGYNYEDAFQLVRDIAFDDSCATVKFDTAFYESENAAERLPTSIDAVDRHWISYLDNLLQVSLLADLADPVNDGNRVLRVPTEIREVNLFASNFVSELNEVVDHVVGQRRVMEGGRKGSFESASSGYSTKAASATEGDSVPGTPRPNTPLKLPDCGAFPAENAKTHTEILRFTKKVRSSLAEIVGLKTSIMARAGEKKREAKQLEMIGQRQLVPVLSQGKVAAGIGFETLMEYVKTECLPEQITVLDLSCDVSIMERLSVMPCVERVRTVFGKHVTEEGKKQYAEKFAGLFEECETVPDDGEWDLILSNTDETLFSKELLSKSKKPARLYGWAPKVSEAYASKNWIEHQKEKDIQKVMETETDGALFTLRAPEGDAQIINLTESDFKSGVDQLVQKLIVAKNKMTEEKNESGRYFMQSTTQGLAGFVRCLNKEPEFDFVRGIQVFGQEENNKKLQKMLKAANALDSKMVFTDGEELFVELLVPNHISSEESLVSLADAKPAAPYGYYLTFPNPGNLEEFKYKAQPQNPKSLMIELGKCKSEEDQERLLSEYCTVDIAYSALNFRDVMLGYNKIDKDALVGHSRAGDGWGLEFSGVVSSEGPMRGKHVMGLSCNSIGNRLKVHSDLLFEVPEGADLAAYASVPCAYATVYYSIIERAAWQPDRETLLIHAGAGGVGQAGLYVALKKSAKFGSQGNVFTTCSDSKRAYLMQKFGPLGLREENIGNTRDLTFEDVILERTEGKGVDVVLNSLSEEKLAASVRCVAPFGRFCEIGKYDIMQDNGLKMGALLKNVSVLGIDVDQLMGMKREWARVADMVNAGLRNGEVQPLDVKVYQKNEITEAFRSMGAGTHLGKVLVHSSNFSGNSREAQKKLDKQLNSVCDLPNFAPAAGRENDAQLIVGGLGGFGLELTKWLAKHGFRNLKVVTRSSRMNGKIAKYFREIQAFGAKVEVLAGDFTKRDQVVSLVESQGGQIGGFWNLAGVLDDGLFTNMTQGKWDSAIVSKVDLTKNFVAEFEGRRVQVENFVIWTSVSGAYGNAGQTNYGYANSYLDTLVRNLKDSDSALKDAALAVNWGAIGNVGMLAKSSAKKTAALSTTFLPQNIDSCLEQLEKLLVHRASGVCAIYATPRRVAEEGDAADGSANVYEMVCGIIGLKAPPRDADTLENLGVDSLQFMEIQNAIKKATDKKIPITELGKMKMGKLREMSQ